MRGPNKQKCNGKQVVENEAEEDKKLALRRCHLASGS